MTLTNNNDNSDKNDTVNFPESILKIGLLML